MAEWASAHYYWDRVRNLRGSRGQQPDLGRPANGNYYLTTGPGGACPPGRPEDQMTGGPMSPTDTNHDWFFGHAPEVPRPRGRGGGNA